MATKESWIKRKEKYGSSGVRNNTLKKQRQSKAQEKRHTINGGLSKETKRKIGEANAIALKGKFYPNSSHFKKEENHVNWQGGKHVYFHRQARKTMKEAGFDIENFDVHHINKNYKDNRLENLQLLSHSEHAKLHALDPSRGRLV